MISYNQIPNAIRTPFWAVEFDNSNAIKGPTVLAYQALMLGMKLSAGSAVADAPVVVTSKEQAITLFGAGSMLAHMCERWFKGNKSTKLVVIPQAENGSGTAAAGSLAFSGTATAAGAINLYVGGRKISVAVANGDSAAAVALAVKTAMNNDANYPITGGTISSDTLPITFKHKGLVGNGVDVRLNHYDGEALPAGIGCVVTALSSGTLNPVLSNAIAAMADEQYHIIACGYNDAVSLTALEAELTERWGPMRPIDGIALIAKNGSVGSLLSYGQGRNSPFVSCQGISKQPESEHEFAAGYASIIAFYGNIDQARPFQTLELPGALPAKLGDRLTLEEQNLLLFAGISTNSVDAGGVVRIQRAITMYQKNPVGAPDESYLEVNTILTNSYYRYDFRAYFGRKYPRHKLADDNYRVPPGQAVMTPKLGKAECVVLYEGWMDLGLAENLEAFKAALIVERDQVNRNRLNFYLAPDLMNQLIVGAAKIAFIL